MYCGTYRETGNLHRSKKMETFQNGKPKNPEALVESIRSILQDLDDGCFTGMTADELATELNEALWIALKDAGYEVVLR